MNRNPAHYFEGLVNVPGVGLVQGSDAAAAAAARGLGDDSAVMMISGLGAASPWPTEAAWAKERARYVAWGQAANTPGLSVQAWAGPIPPETYPGGGETSKPGASPLSTALQQRIVLFNVDLPLWAWLAIAALLGGAGGAGLMHLKMKR